MFVYSSFSNKIAGSDYSIFHTKRGRLFEGGDYKQLLDEVFVIFRIIKVEVGVAEADNPYRDLDYSAYHKNRI